MLSTWPNQSMALLAMKWSHLVPMAVIATVAIVWAVNDRGRSSLSAYQSHRDESGAMPLLESLLSCFGRKHGSVKLTYNKDTHCVFCNISPSPEFDVVLESPTLVVFRDRDPAAKEHLLVTPVKHIRSVRELNSEDVPLLQDMQELGHHALDTLDISRDSRRVGFHIPPFNSVMHLHLHVMGLPFKSTYHRAQFLISNGASGRSKGFSYFVEINQAISILKRGGRIGVFPC